ncbi:P-loop containing nucleoside triphosphate hydrolase protein [Pavlovales sp. CCMP2436]|nr:P-loop containing nucleoside triphosphate hydrolase protein [Pavlovales sp. CCMP2436]
MAFVEPTSLSAETVEPPPIAEKAMEPPLLTEELAGVSADLVGAILAAFGDTFSLTPVQREVLPLALAGKDVLAKAKTGTGKTMAFLIPSVARLLRDPAPSSDVDPIRVLVLSGTRELASQIEAQAARLAANLPGLKLDCVMGGTSATTQRERLDPNIVTSGTVNKKYGGRIDVMVATPGRLVEHMNGTSGFAARLATVETLVLDEVDQLLDGGFQRDIEGIVAALRPCSDAPGGRQTLAFSATVPDKVKATLGVALRPDYETVDTTGGAGSPAVGEAADGNDSHARITQTYSVHSVGESLAAIGACLAREARERPDDFKVLVFCPTARHTMFVSSVLRALEGSPRVLEIHSRVAQKFRDAAAEDFRVSSQVVMLSSDVSARGVDYPGVTLVVQLGAPSSREVYVQRLGRTGRNGASGAGLLLLPAYEKDFVKAELKGLPVIEVPWALSGAECEGAPAVADPAMLRAAAAGVDDKSAAETYRAWLMANASIRKRQKWSKEDFVAIANTFAAGFLGRASPPTIGRGIVTQLGLFGIKGLTVVEDEDAGMSTASSFNSLCSLETEAEEEEDASADLKAKLSTKAMAAHLKREYRAIAEHILALGQAGLLALRLELEAQSFAEVLGCRVEAEWVRIKRPLLSKPPSSSSSSASLASMALTRNLSSRSLPRAGLSSASLSSLAEEAGPPQPTEEEKKQAREQAVGRVISAGKALAAVIGECGGDKSLPAAALALKELESAKADLAALNLKLGPVSTRGK